MTGTPSSGLRRDCDDRFHPAAFLLIFSIMKKAGEIGFGNLGAGRAIGYRPRITLASAAWNSALPAIASFRVWLAPGSSTKSASRPAACAVAV